MIEKNINESYPLIDLIDVSQAIINKLLLCINTNFTNHDITDEETEKYLAYISDNLELFVQIMIQVNRSNEVPMKQRLSNINSIKYQKIHLLSIMKAILQAKVKNDKVMLLDLIEYELKDNLTQWKINILPQIKEILNA